MMRVKIGATVAAMMLASLAASVANGQRFDPRAHKGPQRGVQNEVAVLGTAHLSDLPRTFDPRDSGR